MFASVERFVLVYNADFGLRGGIEYAVRRLRGNDDCALCRITHGALREKNEWKSCRADLGVPVDAVYRNQVDEAMRRVLGGQFPCVLAETSEGYVKVLGPVALKRCAGRVGHLMTELEQAAETTGL